MPVLLSLKLDQLLFALLALFVRYYFTETQRG